MKEEQNILELLRKRYPAGEYALLSEVSNGAGFSRTGSCDYVSIGLWPSRGLEITGIELKSSRGDWLRELKKPEKAEAFFKYCDRWYLLIEDESIATLEELPPTWGLLCAKGKRIITLKEAPKLSPIAVDRSFMAALFKRATQGLIHPDQIEEKLEEACTIARRNVSDDLDRTKRDLNELKDSVREFEKASGINIREQYTWGSPKKLGEAVALVLKNDGLDFMASIKMARERAERAIKSIDSILQESIKETNGQPQNS